MKKIYDVTFVYAGSRSEKLKTIDTSASDFFYGFLELKKNGIDTTFIEIPDKKTGIFDKLIIRTLRLPIYFFKTINVKNFRILFNSKNIVFINESAYLSHLLIVALIKLFKKCTILFFPMGLGDRYLKSGFISKKIIKSSIKLSERVIFIGKGELNLFSNLLKNFSQKYEYLPFSVDTKFWKSIDKKIHNIRNILFIGNDVNRDFKFMNLFASLNKQYNFYFVTSNDLLLNVELDNVKKIKGDWRKQVISDKDILNFYLDSDLVVLPIKETTQPSGQSVALQAMSAGTPVMITKTEGFWDPNLFIDLKNIFFVYENTPESWQKKINELNENPELIYEVAKNGKDLIIENHNITNFSEKLLEKFNL